MAALAEPKKISKKLIGFEIKAASGIVGSSSSLIANIFYIVIVR